MSLQFAPPLSSPHVPVSWGELLDKITILEIKQERIADEAARTNVARELRELWRIDSRNSYVQLHTMSAPRNCSASRRVQ